MRKLLCIVASAVFAPFVSAGATPPSLKVEVATGSDVSGRLGAADGAEVVLLLGGEQRGSLSTCGCKKRPLGSLARVAGYAEALRARDGDRLLLLNGGDTTRSETGTDGKIRADVLVAGDHMVEGLDLGGWDVWNATYRDVPYLEASGAFPEAAVSANLLTLHDGQPGPAAFRVLDVGGVRVAVTGVSRDGTTPVGLEHHGFVDPILGLKDVFPRMQAESDLQVVLAFDLGHHVDDLIRAVPGIDVLVDTADYRERWEPQLLGDTVWVRTFVETQHLVELRLDLDAGSIVAATERIVDLDSDIPSERSLSRLAARQRRLARQAGP